MRSLVTLTEVEKAYYRGKDRVVVFDKLSLSIPEGDFVAIMGPSGSGKTSLLNLMGGVDKPSAGAVETAGERIDKMSESKLAAWRAGHVGYIFQFYNLMPVLSALENVVLPLLLTQLSPSARRAKATNALKIVGLSDRGKHRPRQLSGGQQQRVAIARALVSDPALLLCDEPTGDLDRATADEVMETLQILNRDFGKTIVMVTHDPAAARFAKTVLHLDKGHLASLEAAA